MPEIDVNGFPSGGYGIVLSKYIAKKKRLESELDSILAVVVGVRASMRDGTWKDTPLAEFRDVFLDPRRAFKWFLDATDDRDTSSFNDELEKKRSLLRVLGNTLFDLSPYPDVPELAYELRLNPMDPIRTTTTVGLPAKAYSYMYIMPMQLCQTEFRSNALSILQVEALMDSLAFMNHRGVFHTDIKDDNMMVCDGVIKFIDFGSAVVVTDSTTVQDLSSHRPKRFRHPAYGAALNVPLLSSGAVFDITNKYNGLNSITKSLWTTKEFRTYLLHKNDCFALACAVYSYQRGASISPRQNGGAGMLSCFRTSKYDDAPAYRRQLKSALFKGCSLDETDDDFKERYCSLLYFDNENFQSFLRDSASARRAAQSGGGVVVGGRSRRYIVLNSNGRRYVVWTDKHKKAFINRNRCRVYLSTIRGTYRRAAAHTR